MDWNKFFNDFADKYYSVPDFTNEEHVYALQNYLIEQGMLTEDIDYAIKTLLFEAPKKPTNPKIAKQAKDMGLKWKGKGYGPENVNKVTHKVDGDKLDAVDDEKGDDKEKGGKEKAVPSAGRLAQRETPPGANSTFCPTRRRNKKIYRREWKSALCDIFFT